MKYYVGDGNGDGDMKELKDSNKTIENSQETEAREDPSKGRYWTYVLLFSLLLFFCTFGISYSFYKGHNDDSDHEIETGNIFFNYSDVNQVGNGIRIGNALPIPDSQGKLLVGTNQYFDFNITATTKSSHLHYEVLIRKDPISTLADSKVKVYLSQILSGNEKELALNNMSELPKKIYDGKEYYVLYEKTLESGLTNYGDFFRLRMWVDQKATDYEEQTYSIQVDVHAYQVEEG